MDSGSTRTSTAGFGCPTRSRTRTFRPTVTPRCTYTVRRSVGVGSLRRGSSTTARRRTGELAAAQVSSGTHARGSRIARTSGLGTTTARATTTVVTPGTDTAATTAAVTTGAAVTTTAAVPTGAVVPTMAVVVAGE